MPSDRFTDLPMHDKSTRTMYVPYIHLEKMGVGGGGLSGTCTKKETIHATWLTDLYRSF